MMFLLTHLRLDKRWSKAELARRSKMCASDLGQIENGRIKPYDSQLKKIAKALGHPVKHMHELMKEVEVATFDEKGVETIFVSE